MTRHLRPSLAAPVSLVATLLIGACGAPRPAPRVIRARDVGALSAASLDGPIILELDEGDIVPLRFSLDGPFVRTSDDAPIIPLRVVRHFFLRIDRDGMRASADGKTFDEKPAVPGRFRLGIRAVDGRLGAEMEIRTPVPPGLRPKR